MNFRITQVNDERSIKTTSLLPVVEPSELNFEGLFYAGINWYD